MTSAKFYPVVGPPSFTPVAGTVVKQYRYKKSSDPDSSYTAWATYTTGTQVYIGNYTGVVVPYTFHFRVTTSYNSAVLSVDEYFDEVLISPTTVLTLLNPTIDPAVQQSGTFDVTVDLSEAPPSGLSISVSCSWKAKDDSGVEKQSGSFSMVRTGDTFSGSFTVGTFIKGSTVYGDVEATFSASLTHPIILPASLVHTFEDCWESTIGSTGYPLSDSPSFWSWDTYYEYGWTSVSVTAGEDMTSVKVSFTDLTSDSYAGTETTIRLVGPDGFTYFDLAVPSSWSGAKVFDFGDLSGYFASSAGTWIVSFIDSYGDGGAVGTGGSLNFGS